MTYTACLSKLSIATLKGVGAKTLAKLHELGLFSIQDILFHLPLRYEDRTTIVSISNVTPGARCLIMGEIQSARVLFAGRRYLKCELRDLTGQLSLRFFHFNASQLKTLKKPGVQICCFGEVRSTSRGLEMIHPEYRLSDSADELMSNDKMTPVYPIIQGMKQYTLRRLVDQAFSLVRASSNQVLDGLPDWLIDRYQMPSLYDALVYLHYPNEPISTEQGFNKLKNTRDRLVIEEFLTHQFSLTRLRSEVQRRQACQVSVLDKQNQLIQSLPFELTGAQKKVVNEINRDLAKGIPMLRLVQGDVGCGKTIVAALSAVAVIENGGQVALMAPTELLAEQHYQQFKRWLSFLNITVGWLPGKLPARIKRETRSKIIDGSLSMVVGTHALIQEGVEFKNLALVIIDEQHRFGVYQRLNLKSKGESRSFVPHQLIMTATPIPRSLAMSAYGDLDHSIVDELPPGRKPIQTALVDESRRDQVIGRVIENCKTGCQVYWVCTLVEESEVLQCQAAESTYESLKNNMPDCVVALIHGRMKGDEKEKIMHDFSDGKIDVLVATTVIEVGVDVPNASLMIIENPERLGLAQLHQLRGRVGRGQNASFCVLLYRTPLSKNAQSRLQVIRDSTDGFYIAQQDLLIRGPGELLGTRQSGLASYRIADIIRDQVLLEDAKSLAPNLFNELPESVVSTLIARWLGSKEEVLQV